MREALDHDAAAGLGVRTVDRRSGRRRSAARRIALAWLATAAASLFAAVPASAQIGQLLSPGPLSRAHASLEGADKCQKCHEAGRRLTPALCLACHKPIAERMQSKKGVHRDVTDDCASCHVEHAGVDAELRPLDPASFDHAVETGFPLDGRHAAVAKTCARCHKTRSFLAVTPACSTCHTDIHKPSLGSDCRACHSTAVAFKDARTGFDHSKAAFQLTGAHRRVACAKCHANQVFKGLKFAQCTDCHKSPHRQPMSSACTSCHTNDSWKTQRIDHAKTAFPLRGRHADVACVKCHTKPPLQAALKFDRCAACHQDPHRAAFKQDCSSCHNETGFGRGTFDHATGTKFPLTGAHAPLACAKCHKNAPAARAGAARVVEFRGLATSCVSCHEDVHKAVLGKACEACHTSVSFRVPTFTHPRLPEFFAGQHQGVPCAKCHVPRAPGTPARTGVPVSGWTFKNLPTACASCHQDVHLGQVGAACEACHRVDAAKFAPVGFNHATAAFTLSGRHETVECRKCHKPETGTFPAGAGTAVRLRGVAKACASCHQDQHLGQLGRACESCHTAASFKVPAFTHANQRYFFVGKHAVQPCSACHKPENAAYPGGRGLAVRYKGLTACASCHTDAHAGSMGSSCEGCHTPDGWVSASRAFHKTSRFTLEGRHLAVPCASCHIKGAVKGTPTKCVDCHWVRRQDDPYRTRLGADCETCHRPISWTAVTWNHGAATGTPLSPAHRALACDSCHTNRRFDAGSPSCYSCHAKQYQSTTQPSHLAAGFPTQCEACHKPSHTSFTQANFQHNAYFPLSGTHAAQACASCHRNSVYKGTPRDCYGCHRTDYERSASPNHAAAGFPTACESCHRSSDASWKTTFNHNTVYPLAGAHATQACTACHKNNVYKGTPRDCFGCHRINYERTASPNHAAAGFPTACESCHRPSDASWKTTFNHNSAYPLAGVHATQACTACHKNNVYKGTPRDCVGCHRTNYDRTTSPNHASAGFPTACESCHRASDASWRATFSHNSVFALVGVHATQACTACHKNNVYKGTPRDCVGCHRTNYDRTTNPNHASAGFPTACESCHRASDASWRATFSHNSVFALVGVHATQACTACHKNNVYKGTPRDCFSCHRTNYERTANPNHAAAGFPTACESCHSASSATWSASFDHNRFFVLAGRHLSATCSSCHRNSVYRGTPRECYPCHSSQYDRTTNPNHRAAGFPTTCETCHRNSDSSFNQGRFNHTWFPITSGKHAGRACAECHLDSNNFKVFTCTTCHTRSRMDSQHAGRAGYRYDSAACYSCHPTGQG